MQLNSERGGDFPSFIFNVMTVETIQPIVEKIIPENLPDAFLVSIKVNMGLKSSIQIFNQRVTRSDSMSDELLHEIETAQSEFQKLKRKINEV